MGALAGSILDRDHPLAGAIKGGIGAMMAEVIAESLVDRQQIQQEVIQDLGLEEGRPLSKEDKALYEAAYREKLYPAMNTAKLVVASVMASFGHDPSIAITTATNALENNFLPTAIALAFEAYPVVVAGLGMGAATAAAVKAKQEIDKSLSGKNSMDIAPEDAQWIDEGFTAAEQRPTVYSTPIPDYELPNEGYAPWIGNLPTLEEYDLPSGLVDTSILNKQYRGGAFGNLKTGNGIERHHIPADSINSIPREKGPAIQMDKNDHYQTKSWGNSQASKEYKQDLKIMIDEGKIRDAIALEIKDVRSFSETKYNKGIKEMLDYAKSEGYINKNNQ